MGGLSYFEAAFPQFSLVLGSMRAIILVVSLICLFMSCQPSNFTPKQTGYFRIDTPLKHEYQLFDAAGYPYSFEYPTYSKLMKDSAFFKEKADNPYWINIYFPSFNGTINLTYKHITPQVPLDMMLEESYKLSFFHHEKAEYIHDYVFKNTYGMSGILYTVGGNAASRYQFILTDSFHHFMRGALYFEVTPNADSLAPANDFIFQDILHLMNTMRWKQ